jgi:hypothetical protein
MREWVHRPLGLDVVPGQTVRCQGTVLVAHAPAPAPCGPAGGRELRWCRSAP